ncbi:MAG: radical SAM protein [Succinivibrionaceae bacterium]
MTSNISFMINEIFASINGEGPLSGELAIFIRLSGCNLRCTYCDTLYAQKNDSGILMNIPDILNKLKEFSGIKNITLTGGEPLFRKNINHLLSSLTERGYIINIETNGSIDLSSFISKPYAHKLIFCCDYKLPYSGEESKMILKNIEILRPQDALKFVIGNSEDFVKTFNILKKFNPISFIYLSAVFNQISPKEIVEKTLEWSKEINTTKIRVQLQLHKYIWDPTTRGV